MSTAEHWTPEPGLPQMPAGYGVKDGPSRRPMAWSAVQDRLRAARNYWLATASSQGRPHVMPVWGLWQEDGFYFGTDPASRKGRNLAANPNAALHLESGDEVVIVQGVVRQAQGAARLAALADAYQAKYQVRPEEGFYWLRPRTALAWTEKDFPNNATRWRFP